MTNQFDLPTIAGGGLLDRRVFLKKGFTFSVAALTSESLIAATENQRLPWMEKPGQPLSNYGLPLPS